MQNYVSDSKVDFNETGVRNAAFQGTPNEELPLEKAIIEETEIQESITTELEEVEYNPRRLGYMRLTVGFIISSISTSLIIAGNATCYGLLTLGLIWILIGIKECIFPDRSDQK